MFWSVFVAGYYKSAAQDVFVILLGKQSELHGWKSLGGMNQEGHAAGKHGDP